MPDRRSRRGTKLEPDGPVRWHRDGHVRDQGPAAPDSAVVASATFSPAASGGDGSPTTVARDYRVRGIGRLLVLLGAAGVLGSGFFHWLDLTVSRGGFQVTRTTTATGVPVQFLWDSTTRSHDPTVLAVLVPSAVLAVLGVGFRRVRKLTLLAGSAAICVGALYAFQVNQTIDDVRSRLGGLVNPGVRDVLGVAPLACFAGGVAIVLGSLLTKTRGSDYTDASDRWWQGERVSTD